MEARDVEGQRLRGPLASPHTLLDLHVGDVVQVEHVDVVQGRPAGGRLGLEDEHPGGGVEALNLALHLSSQAGPAADDRANFEI